MHNSKPIQSGILAFMRFTFIQITIILSVSAMAYSNHSRGQEVLEKKISLNAKNENLKSVLRKIEQQIAITFTYNADLIANKNKVTIALDSIPLRDAIDRLFNYSVEYETVNTQVILRSRPVDVSMQNVPAFSVSGTVSDQDGAILPGVNVVVKGSTLGTTTDAEGKYALTVEEGTETLIFSFIGYAVQEVPINSRSVIDVTMAADITSLDEVVVIGYGTAEKKEITSSVARINSKDFNTGNVFDPAQFLQGKVAGLSIVKPGADPNAGYNIRLRGLSTFGANSSPLIIIDGVLGGSLQLVDPNEIESIDVLKDGSAAAIYGTRGSSGVIIVTTKKGKQGVSGVDFNSYVSFEELAKTVEIASAERFIAEGGPNLGSQTDWVDQVTRTGVSQAHNIAYFGNSGLTNYRISLNYRDVEGIAIGSGFEQINSRLNLNHSALNDKLMLSSTIGVTLRKAEFIPYEAMRFALISNPTAPIYVNNNPQLGYAEPNSTEYHNAVAIVNETTDDGNFKTMLASFKAEYEILEGLKVSGFYSLQYESDLRSQYYSSRMRFLGSAGLGGRATKFTEDRNNQLFELTGSFKKIFNKLTLDVVGGYSYQKLLVENFDAFNTGFYTDELLYNNLGFGLGLNSDLTNQRGFGSEKAESLLASFFGRVMLNRDDTYFLTLAYRREGSSRFGPNERWGDFYSVSGGVDFSRLFETPFDVLKLRAGYGLTGNLPVEFYSYLPRLNTPAAPASTVTSINDGTSNRLIRLFSYVSNPNPDLKWEQKGELNIGLDFGVFGNRLTGSVDYYTRTSTDIIFRQPVSQPPNFFGFTLLNLGELESKGIEVVLNYNVLNKSDLTYTTGLTYSRNKTKIIELNGESQVFNGGNLGPPGLNNTLPIRARVGQELGLIQAPIYLGLDENGMPALAPLQDENNNGILNERYLDWPIVGKALPDFELSWNNSLTYKNFDLNLTMRGAFGHSLVNVNRAYYEVPQNSSNYNLVVTKYYDPARKGSEQFNSYYVEKADFFKLDNIALGYNIKFNNSPFKRLRFYVSGQNLFVLTDYTGVDPEVRYTTVPDANGVTDPLYPGVEDRNSYFRSRTYTVGVNIGF